MTGPCSPPKTTCMHIPKCGPAPTAPGQDFTESGEIITPQLKLSLRKAESLRSQLVHTESKAGDLLGAREELQLAMHWVAENKTESTIPKGKMTHKKITSVISYEDLSATEYVGLEDWSKANRCRRRCHKRPRASKDPFLDHQLIVDIVCSYTLSAIRMQK